MLKINPQRLRALTDERLHAVEAEQRVREEEARIREVQRIREAEERAARVISDIPTLCEQAAREGKRVAQVMSMTDHEFVGPQHDHTGGLQESWFAYGALPVFQALRDSGFRMTIDRWDDRMSGYSGYYLHVHW